MLMAVGDPVECPSGQLWDEATQACVADPTGNYGGSSFSLDYWKNVAKELADAFKAEDAAGAPAAKTNYTPWLIGGGLLVVALLMRRR